MRPPAFTQTIRFRLTVMYSTLLFVLTALVLGGVYWVIAANTDARPISKTFNAEKVRVTADGSKLSTGQVVEVVKESEVASAIHYETQRTLRNYSLGVLGGLFVASLGIGWVLSGRALRPVAAITAAAEEIQATDLSRRIRLAGPKDELRSLADTVDSMLDRLDAAFEAQRRLIDDASHELRSPLAIIRANLDAVLTAPGTDPADHDRAVQVVDRATTRMTRLVEDLLATARRSAPALDDADVDLATVAREAVEEHGPLAAERGQTLVLRTTPGLTVIGDHDALRRAVGNLLSNAVRLAPPASAVTVGAGRRDGWLWLAVKDTGPGIRADDRERVFDRFWRGDRHRPGERRTGLGLAIVRHIAESHGGQVRLHSEEDVGSTFVLWFPVSPTGEQPPPVDPLAAPNAASGP
ncbi:sensor histidine kinase [Actinomadura kijaniata]|uniref:sensor histidine kinase n=1 Tax=Actinomadura kijaniata TaxID=46161 RepID=UPI0008378B01|nr:HAMP domain-containing sensor histidine kinase [Actinomadura kijaniata]